MEEGDEGLVGNLLNEELEGVAVVGNAGERVEDGAEDSPTSNCTYTLDRPPSHCIPHTRTVANATKVRRGEDLVLLEVD